MFEIGFAVEVDPEFPGDGGEPPLRMPPGLLRIGAVLRVTAPGADPWDIAVGSPGWWRTPIPTAIAFISDWRGYLVDVVTRRVVFDIAGVVRIREDQRHDLLLMVTEGHIVAIGRAGIAWTTEPVADDDLKVVSIEADGIVCTGYVGGMFPQRIVIDPLTGQVEEAPPPARG